VGGGRKRGVLFEKENIAPLAKANAAQRRRRKKENAPAPQRGKYPEFR